MGGWALGCIHKRGSEIWNRKSGIETKVDIRLVQCISAPYLLVVAFQFFFVQFGLCGEEEIDG
jgi:hypothetical protein